MSCIRENQTDFGSDLKLQEQGVISSFGQVDADYQCFVHIYS